MKFYKKVKNVSTSDLTFRNNNYYSVIYVELTKDNVRYLFKALRYDYDTSRYKLKDLSWAVSCYEDEYQKLKEVRERNNFLLDKVKNKDKCLSFYDNLYINEKMNDYEEVKGLDESYYYENKTLSSELIESLKYEYSKPLDYSKFNKIVSIDFYRHYGCYSVKKRGSSITDCILQSASYEFGELRFYLKAEGFNLVEEVTLYLDRSSFSCGVVQLEGLQNLYNCKHMLKDILLKIFDLVQVETLVCSDVYDSFTINCLNDIFENCDTFDHVSLDSYNNNSGNEIRTYIIKRNDMMYECRYYDDYDDYEDED